jgi:hypothetical protein
VGSNPTFSANLNKPIYINSLYDFGGLYLYYDLVQQFTEFTHILSTTISLAIHGLVVTGENPIL